MNIFLTFSMDASEAAGSADIVEILCSADGALQFESIIAEIEMLERVDAVLTSVNHQTSFQWDHVFG
jgi:hypothetical protein